MNSSSVGPVLFLLFTPILTAELLTGSTPIYAIINPVNLALLLGLYGAGALLVRELALIWNKGWPTIMVLGAAYGVVEEGLDVKTWFNPNWPALGNLGTYGRYAGVNWVWAAELTVFHAVFSIGIPIALTGIVFPQTVGKRWLRGWKMWFVAAVFTFHVILGLILWPYSPPVPQYLGPLAFAVTLALVASKLPSSVARSAIPSRIKVWKLAALGIVLMTVFFAIVWVLSHTGLPAAADILLILLLVAVTVRYLSAHIWSGAQAFSLIAGAIGFLIVIDILTVNFVTGAFFVAAAYLLALAFLWKTLRLQKRNQMAPLPGAAS